MAGRLGRLLLSAAVAGFAVAYAATHVESIDWDETGDALPLLAAFAVAWVAITAALFLLVFRPRGEGR